MARMAREAVRLEGAARAAEDDVRALRRRVLVLVLVDGVDAGAMVWPDGCCSLGWMDGWTMMVDMDKSMCLSLCSACVCCDG